MNYKEKIVSDPNEQLILVDSDDNEIGYSSKSDCHKGLGILHRAFSVFLFDSSGELLLQKRSAKKELWGQYWSNSCCSHPADNCVFIQCTAGSRIEFARS